MQLGKYWVMDCVGALSIMPLSFLSFLQLKRPSFTIDLILKPRMVITWFGINYDLSIKVYNELQSIKQSSCT